ncbi:centrosomal protein of 63 kDa-like isoform X2 [Aricia agestis]|uniref:centrosomal protein of 63 kDa-like isoform X2 n=1 Tax=Aricia agestis TaxID=91739 RepID=UPI001C20A2BC|nr:centrosomal protein of 63 kDa-like isoform X2 [Aricia agestis]
MESDNTDENLKLKACGSAEEFQAFITNLFEKNGVLNDLRAYLRGHVFTFLQSVQSGDIPETKKHFTQRLQFKFQAINAVIAEYLMKQKFGYSLSVFISEIPLANMAFDFAKNLYKNSMNDDNLQFSTDDIFQILNYLGVHSDQVQMLKILEDYQNHDEPLLMSILKNLTSNLVYNVDEDSLNIDSLNKKNKCKHYLCCELCQNYLFHIKEKYKKRKKHMVEFQKGLKLPCNNSDEKAMDSKIKMIEERLIEEMFEQLKNVYEGEIEILREGDEKKVKRSIVNHASLMQKHRLELEKEMESRRIVMEAEFRERKEFVEGLAATLKDAHEKLKDARHKMKKDAAALTNKENSLKSQLQKAEETLKIKGEEMQKQISHELKLLDEQQQNLNKERNAIDNERQELEKLKKLNETNLKLLTTLNMNERANLVQQYNYLKNELDALKKYIALSSENKANQDTLFKINNETTNDNDTRVKVNHVVNDLKKLKNVNFSQTVSMYHKWSQDVTSYSRCDGTCSDTLKRLREEHEKLQEFSKQQSSHIELLSLSLRQINQTASNASTNSVPLQTNHKELIAKKDTSSNKTIREAKLRLKKLEIEAEAVEKSYLKFRQKRAQENRLLFNQENYVLTSKMDTKEIKHVQKENQRCLEENKIDCNHSYEKIHQQTNLDFDKYLRKYHDDDKITALNIRLNKVDELKYKRNTMEDKERKGEWHSLNYLETPLMEFRKLYQSSTNIRRNARKKQNKIDLYCVQKVELDFPNRNTSKHTKSKEAENTLDKCLVVEPNASSQTEIEVSGEETTELKVLNTTKVSEYDGNSSAVIENALKSFSDNVFDKSKEDSIIISTKKSSSNNVRMKNDTKEPIVNEKIVEITRAVEEIISEKSNKILNEPDFINDLVKVPQNESTRDNVDLNGILKESSTNIKNEDSVASDTSKDPSGLKTKTSDNISAKSSKNVQKHDANAETENIDHTNPVTEVDNPINIPPLQETDIDINENRCNSISVKDNINTNKTEESKSDTPKETRDMNNSVELNEEKSKEIEKHSGEYEEDFSIPDIDNSLLENKTNSPISILKSSEGENFWD